jgi:hypothetical protein
MVAKNSELFANNTGIKSMGKSEGINLLTNSLLLDSSILANDVNNGGDAGLVSVSVNNDMTVINGGVVSSSTFATGDTGNITVDAGQLIIDGQGSENVTGILSDAEPNSTGKAGTVLVMVNDNMQILNGGIVSSNTFEVGDAGNVKVYAGQLTIDGRGIGRFTGIFSISSIGSRTEVLPNGNAGTILVSVNDDLIIKNGGQISSVTSGKGHAGSVTVKTARLAIDGRQETDTGIFSLSRKDSNGKAGNINITATDQMLLLNGTISISSLNTTLQPSTTTADPNPTPAIITINTPTLRLEQNSIIEANARGGINAAPIEINVTDNLELIDSQITTSADNGNGGSITVNANNRISLKNSQLTTSVLGEINGKGGDISLTAPILLMDTGFIQANTAALFDDGGDINLNIRQLVASGDSLLKDTTEPLFFDTNRVNYNVIQATSEFGINGNINISSPELNIVGALAGVNIPELDIGRMGKDPCASSLENTLKSLGHGGVPAFQNGENYLPVNRFGNPKNKLKEQNTSSSSTSVNQASHQAISIECSKT